MSEQQIEGVPDGWRLVAIRRVKNGEWFIGTTGDLEQLKGTMDETSFYVYGVVEKIEQPKRYRPFANAAEFEPHRDRWFNRKSAPGQVMKTTAYNDRQVWIGDGLITWQQMFESYTFESGTPFGVEVTE